MKTLLTFLILITAFISHAQNNEKFNLRFEIQKINDNLPDGWIKWGQYDISTDAIAYEGKNSIKISSSANAVFGSLVYPISANYSGKSIKLEGFMKIKDVKNGHAGLIMRIDDKNGSVGFDNMQNQKVRGTRDWMKYSISLELPTNAETIYVGGILLGQGEAWFDDLVVSIDGENIQTLEETEKEYAKAELDQEYDDGSPINLSNLTTEKIDNLELLGRVWGFLKYHHPEIAQGNYNWDYELFRFLPNYMAIENETARDEMIIKWIDSLGKVEKRSNIEITDKEIAIKPDLKWITYQDKNLQNKLLYVYENRSQGENYYIGMFPGIGNPEFKNENEYKEMTFPDDGFRLLSLYRYWNMINYFFPYKDIMDEDWNNKLSEYIPIFINAKDELAYQLAALQIIGDITDAHANLRGAKKVHEWKGVNYSNELMEFIEDELVVTGYFVEELKDENELKIGDVISKINGKTITQLIEEKTKYYPASNHPTRLHYMANDLLRSNENTIEIEFKSADSQAKEKALKLFHSDSLMSFPQNRNDDEKSYKMLEHNIGYITLASIKEEDVPNIRKEFKKAKGIIIDIRNYPSTFVPFSLGSFFVNSEAPFVKFTSGSIENPGQFTFTESLSIPNEGKTFKGKLVVLTNEKSISQAEYTAMAFRAGDNTTILGSTTAGADGNISTIILPGGLSSRISGIGVFYPDGGQTQRIGIVPDIEIKPTIEGIKAGRDELIEKAIEVIKAN